jgi:hypothetical protein
MPDKMEDNPSPPDGFILVQIKGHINKKKQRKDFVIYCRFYAFYIV